MTALARCRVEHSETVSALSLRHLLRGRASIPRRDDEVDLFQLPSVGDAVAPQQSSTSSDG